MNQSQFATSSAKMELQISENDDEEFLEHPEETRNTLWENPTDKDVVMDLHVGTNPLYGNGPRPTLHPFGRTREQRLGVKQFVVKAGKTREIPSEFDVGVQQTECRHPDCSSRKLYCKDKTHPSQIVGGLGPQLINRGMKVRPRLSPALDAALAEQKELEQKALDAYKSAADAKRDQEVTEGKLLLAQKQLAEREQLLLAKEKALAEHAAKEKDLADREAKVVAASAKQTK